MSNVPATGSENMETKGRRSARTEVFSISKAGKHWTSSRHSWSEKGALELDPRLKFSVTMNTIRNIDETEAWTLTHHKEIQHLSCGRHSAIWKIPMSRMHDHEALVCYLKVVH